MKYFILIFLSMNVSLNLYSQEEIIPFSEMLRFSQEIKKTIENLNKEEIEENIEEKEELIGNISKRDFDNVLINEKRIMIKIYREAKKDFDFKKHFRAVFDLAINLGLFDVAENYGKSIERINNDWMDSGSYDFYMSYVYALNGNKQKSSYYWKLGKQKTESYKEKSKKNKGWWRYKRYYDESKKIEQDLKNRIKNCEEIFPNYKNFIKELMNNISNKDLWENYYRSSKDFNDNLNKINALRFLLEHFKEKDVNLWLDLAETYYRTKQYNRVIKLKKDFLKEGLEKAEVHYFVALSYKEIGDIQNARKEIQYTREKYKEDLEKHNWKKEKFKKLEQEL